MLLNPFKPLKAPGTYGIHPFFFQIYWTDTNSAVIVTCVNAFNTLEILEDINKTFVTLIPKVKHPQNITQYRSSSLCNTIYKTITKIIVNRMISFPNDIISPNQCSFIPWRRAIDNAIIIQKAIDSFRKTSGRTRKMMLKIDLENAFDMLEWSFVRNSLQALNIPKELITLIMNCISTTSTSIIANGKPTEFFKPCRSIR